MKHPKFAAATALLLFTAAFSAAQVKSPPIGIARLADASVRTLYGLSDNVIVDTRSAGSFDAASFSDQAGLVASHGRIQLVKTNFALLGEYDSAEPRPLLNVDGGASSAIAWLPGSESLLHWNGESFVLTAVHGLDRSARVTSVRVQGKNIAQLLLAGSSESVSEASVSMESGNLVSLKTVPGVHGAAFFWQGAAILFRDSNGLEAMARDGAIRTIAAIVADVAFDHISSNWVLVTSPSDGRTWALHVEDENIHLCEVPAVVTREVTK